MGKLFASRAVVWAANYRWCDLISNGGGCVRGGVNGYGANRLSVHHDRRVHLRSKVSMARCVTKKVTDQNLSCNLTDLLRN